MSIASAQPHATVNIQAPILSQYHSNKSRGDGEVITLAGEVATVAGEVATVTGEVVTVAGDVVTVAGEEACHWTLPVTTLHDGHPGALSSTLDPWCHLYPIIAS